MRNGYALGSISLSNGLKIRVGDKILCVREVKYGDASIHPGELFEIESIEFDTTNEKFYVSVSTDNLDLLEVGLQDEYGIDIFLRGDFES